MRPFVPTKKPPKSGFKMFFVFALLLIALFYASIGAFVAVSSRLNMAALPFWHFANSVSGDGIVLRSKAALVRENEDLRRRVAVLERELKGYDFVVQENLELKKLFAGKKDGGEKNIKFASVLLHPGRLPFDVFLLDVGGVAGVMNGQAAFADQNIALGKITETYPHSSKVKAFSSPGEVTDVFLGPENIPVQLKGAGGGAFTAELPRDLDVREGDAAVLPGSDGFLIAFVEKKEENIADSFQKLYLRNPVNVFQLKHVQVTPISYSYEE